MKSRRIVISGGPGSGKTSLISHLERKGHTCMPEISREVTIAAQKKGMSQLYLKDPLLFSEKILKGRLEQFIEVPEWTEGYIFYDRGMPDVTAYLEYTATDYPIAFSKTCKHNSYDAVFLLPPWEAIYSKDNERYESFEEAKKLYPFLKKSYQKFDYSAIEVPFGTIKYRAAFILDKLKILF